MKAAILPSVGASVTVAEVPEPELVRGSVIVRVLRAGVGSAAKACFAGQAFAPPPVPYTPGPNGLSVVEEVAEDVHGLEPGQIVVHDPLYLAKSNHPLVQPAGLLIGWFPMTPNAEFITNLFKNGSWAEKQLIPADCVHPVTPEVFERLGMNTLLRVVDFSIAYGALLSGSFVPGHSVLVNGGTGKLGASAVALALAMGSPRVYVVGRSAAQLEKLHSLDPERVVSIAAPTGSSSSLQEQIPFGVDLVIDFLGYVASTQLTEACLACLRPGGTAVFGGGVLENVPVPYQRLLALQQKIVGTFMFPKTTPSTILQLLSVSPLRELAAKLSRAVRELPLDKVDEAVELAAKNADDVVLIISSP